MNINRLLVIDDEAPIRDYFRDVAEELGFEVAEASDHATFVAEYARLEPTVIILDLTMPGTDGIELLRDLATLGCKVPILLASGQDERILTTTQRLGRMFGLVMHSVLSKPVSVDALECTLRGVFLEENELSAAELEHAIAHDELLLHFQPKIGLDEEGKFPVVGSEALVRWMHPARGLVPPDAFIGLAEETNLIRPLTEVVLQKSIAQLCEWRDMGVTLPVSINLSPSQLTDLTLPDHISKLLRAADLDPSLLMVEITEQAAMADIAKATDILTRLRLKNIAVSLDDFGAGYSSLVEIYRLPLSELKFDRSLIADIEEDAAARTVVKALIDLSRSLKLPVCVEGVETMETVRFLQSAGCGKTQGFFFCKPVVADEFMQFVRKQNGGECDAVDGLDHHALA